MFETDAGQSTGIVPAVLGSKEESKGRAEGEISSREAG